MYISYKLALHRKTFQPHCNKQKNSNSIFRQTSLYTKTILCAASGHCGRAYKRYIHPGSVDTGARKDESTHAKLPHHALRAFRLILEKGNCFR